MKEHDFQVLIALFNEQSTIVNEYLRKALNAVEGGRVPSSDEMVSLNEMVMDLRQQYDAIYVAAEHIMVDLEPPVYGTSIEAIATDVKQSMASWVKEQLEKAKNVFSRFIRVQSIIDSCAIALKPYQEEATAYLNQLSEETVEQLLPKTEGPELFLQAMDVENILCTNGIELVKSMKAYFPEEEIQYGLIGKQFYDGKLTEVDSSSAVNTDKPSSLNSETADEPTAEGGQGNLIIEPVTVEKSEHQTIVVSEPTYNQTESDSMERSTAVAEADATPEAKKYAIVNRVKTNSPSASGFQNDILRMARGKRAIKTVLPLFTNLGILTREQIYHFRVYMQLGMEKTTDDLDSALDFLVDKGYLAQFYDGQQTEFFCLTTYCAGCLRKDKIQKMKSFWDVSCGNVYVTADREIDASVVLQFFSANQTLLNYLNTQCEDLPSKQFQQVMSSIKWVKDHYQVAIVEEGTFHMAVTVNPGTVWNESGVSRLIVDGSICDPSHFDGIDAKVFVIYDGKLTLFGCSEKGQNAIDNHEPPAAQATEGSSNPMDAEQKTTVLGAEAANAKQMSTDDVPKFGQDSQTTQAEIPAFEPVQEQPIPAGTPKVEPTQEQPKTSKDELAQKQPVITASPKTEPFQEPDSQFQAVQRENRSVVEAYTNDREKTPEPLTMQHLLTLDSAPSDEEFCRVVHAVLAQPVEDGEQLTSVIVQTVLLAKGAGLETDRPMSLQFSDQMQLATDLFLDERHDYSSKCLSAAFAEKEKEVPALTLAAYMYAMLKPAEGYDYGLKAQTNVYFDDYESYFAELPQFKKAV